MYDAVADPYCYPGTAVLKNLLDIRDQATLDQYEAEVTAARAEQPFPSGKLDTVHYCRFHHHLFQDVFEWAGRYRTVRIAKGENYFCYPEYIAVQMNRLFSDLRRSNFFQGQSATKFADTGGHFLAELNSIHPFREGNGRAQLAFFAHLADHAGRPLQLKRLDPDVFMTAMIASFLGDEAPLTEVIADLL
ncbi:Filamentation induced by cAMP protein Fic [Rhodopseudomonas palustris HaA2]|uniref:protein adenylyltransferase n=1 Tax=Rhodopseudomonas palustris (strain HaA2) TaxID=316058 RepID=Q2IYL9_RHOP2|nr:Fic family protein [Rhodopseudomonas palustris]ABD06691.1 Filamentation induced by cAMP protein Fic [Rhodopseudomonas palustris HaA2]